MVEQKAVNRVIRFTEKKPFWIFTDDKIYDSASFMQWIIDNGTDFNNDFKINEISKDKVVVLTKNPNIEYFQFTRAIEPRNYFYYKTNTKFISNDFYQLDFELDWYATYYLEIARDVYSKKMYVKRSHDLLDDPMKTSVVEDERLNSILPVNTDLKFLYDNLVEVQKDYKHFYKVENSNIGFTLNQGTFKNLYGVWKAQAIDQKDGYYFLPITSGLDTKREDMYILVGDEVSGNVYSFNNSILKIREINKNSNWANGFVGIFTGPNYIYLASTLYEIKSIPNTSSKTLMDRMFINSYFKDYEITKPLFNYNGFKRTLNKPLKLNFIDGLYSPNILNYMDIKIGNSKLDALNFQIDRDQFKIKPGFVSFNESNFSFYNRVGYEGFKDVVKTFPGPLMSEAQPYLQYIEQNKNRINTSLALSGAGIIGSIGTSLMMGNPLGLLGAVGGVKNILNTTANLNDKKHELLDKPNASYDNDNAFYWLYSMAGDWNTTTSMVYYRKLENLAAFNNQIVYYGWKQEKYLIPDIDTILNVVGNTHFYLQIDANDFFLQNQALFNKIPFIYWENIINMLNNGIRLWKGDVSYNYA